MRKWLFVSAIVLLPPIWEQDKAQESFGIDVSHHNGEINWEQVPDVEFVYIKATEGATYVDPMYLQNIKGARARKLRVGAYHYFRTTSSVQKQFENYKKHVKKSNIDLIPMVDVEECRKWSTVQFQDSLMRFIQLIKSHYGKAPMIYSVNSFYNKYCAPKFNKYYMMIGRYGSEKPFIKGMGKYTIWQKSQTGKLKGIPKNVDIDVFCKEVLFSQLRIEPLFQFVGILDVVTVSPAILILNDKTKHLLDSLTPLVEGSDRQGLALAHVVVSPTLIDLLEGNLLCLVDGFYQPNVLV